MGKPKEPSANKDQAAARLARKRWQAVPKAERTRIAQAMNQARWGKRGRRAPTAT
jgi:hypothetical protein